MSLLDSAARVICRWSATLSGILLIGMTLVTVIHVAGRYLFSSPITGAHEILVSALVAVVFLAIGEVELHGRHIRVTIITSQLPSNVWALIDYGTHILTLGILVIIAWQSAAFGYANWASGSTTQILQIPVSAVVFILVLGVALSILAFLSTFLHKVSEILKRGAKLYLWLIPIGAVSLLILASPLWLELLPFQVGRLEAGLIGFLFMILLVFLGAPVFTALIVVGYIGSSYITNLDAALVTLGTTPYSALTSYTWVVIPLFIFMGIIVGEGGLGKDVYTTFYKWLGRIPGGLAMASVGGCAGFAAACGNSFATAITMSKVALPEMMRYKYDPKLATGCLAAGGTLGIMIPPSIAFIIYGLITETSIGQLFIAGVFPGILLTLLFMLLIYIRVRLNPRLAEAGPSTSLKEKLISLRGTVGILVLFLVVIGGLYLGLFTPNEGGAMGVFGAFLFALALRRWSWQKLVSGIREAVILNGVNLILLVAALILGFFVTVSNLPRELASLLTVLGLGKWSVLGLVILMYIILGCIMPVIASMIITLPVIFPVIFTIGFDPIWFGVILVVTMEMGQITPPVGLNVLGISSVARDVPVGSIFKGTFPFLLMMVLLIGILIFFPQIATFLPRMMK